MKRLAAILLSGVATACTSPSTPTPITSPPPQTPTAPPIAQCLTRPAFIQVLGPPPFICGATGPATVGIMGDINTFWQSNAIACSCSFDAPPTCVHNAFATQNGPGYIYYDPSLLNTFAAQSGSLLPPAYVLAHEFGHDIQFEYGLSSPVSILNELGADCYSGYFIGNLICQNRTNQNDIQQTIMQTCSGGDAVGTPWWNPSAHGSCQQRVTAVLRGIAANQAGIPPNTVCGAYTP